MTALSNAQRPAGINTLERQLAYDLLLLAQLNPTLRVIEQAGTTIRAVEVIILPADDGTIRLIGRVSIPLDEDYTNDITNPLFMNAKEISNVTVPDNWKQAGT